MAPVYELGSCPACGGGDAVVVANAERYRREVEALWAFHLRRLPPGTPPERLVDRVVFSQRPPLLLHRCRRCGTLHRNPRERERGLVEGYAGEEFDEGALRALFEAQRSVFRPLARRLSRLAGGAGQGLEVGSYVGAFLAVAAEEGWRFVGIDVNERACRFARGLGFQAERGTIEEWAEGAAPGSLDAVAIWNCFEQLPDPFAAARAARRLLRPGGLLALRVPNGAFYAALAPRLSGPAAPLARALLAHSNLLGFPYRFGFTPSSLDFVLRRAGFEVIELRGAGALPVAVRGAPWWAEAETVVARAVLGRVWGPRLSPWIEAWARRAD